jgi:glycosyltransferase involved in cell wall biosynthesis
MTLMKIAYDHQIFGWQRYGGVSRYFFELANNVASSKVGEVNIVSPFYVNSYLASASSELRVIGRKMPAIRRTGRIYRAINQLLAPLAMRALRPDVVHETYYSTTRQAPKSSKVVLTVFDMIHERFPESFSKWDPLRKEKEAAVKRADHIVCISEHTRQDLIQLLGVKQEKISVVHLGFSLTEAIKGEVSKARRPYLLHVGGRAGYKNFETLLRAYAGRSALAREFDLVAFGGGDFDAKERALIGALGLSDSRVRQEGGGDSILAGLYQGAALFVYPSRYEGFGIPPLEAMSFDCPVVCSNSSSIPEVVDDAAAFFDPASSDSIADAMESVLNNAAFRETLILRGRERIKMFSWQRCAEQTLDVYRKVLA